MDFDIPVLIAGGGPVGMTLALELARHGVRSLVVERNDTTTKHPKMDLTNGRSMELYRRLGLSAKLRDFGVPVENPFDVMWATSPSGHLLHNFEYPSAAEREAEARAKNDGTFTAEPGMRISQIILEPVLREAMNKNALIEARFGWKFDDLEQDKNGVTATVINDSTGERHMIRAHYLVGCDGGGSRVRRKLGVDLDGEQRVNDLIRDNLSQMGLEAPPVPELARVLLIHFKSKEIGVLNPWGVAWHLQTAIGTLVAQDDKDTWTLHVVLPPGTDESTISPDETLAEFVGKEIDYEILVSNVWSPRLVIAEKYRIGRVLMAGDSVHQVIPSGGYGMNTGVGDAIGLGWALAAVVNGWGGSALLDTYESERRYIAEQNRNASERHFRVRTKIAEAFMGAIQEGHLEQEGPEGDERRIELGARIKELGNAENESWGIEHGYCYYGSAAVAQEDTPPPEFDPLRCTPSTYPGMRLPHVYLADGTPLIDQLSPGFTLLAIGGTDTGDFEAVARELGIPFEIVELKYEPALRLLERKLILVRPDTHVAWRGDAPVASRPIWQRVAQLDLAMETNT